MPLFEEVTDFQPVKVPMRDGATLLGDLYLPQYAPDGTGPYPTLVRMTPYPRRRRGLHSEIQYFVAHGYAVLIVSNRGRFGSDRASADEGESSGLYDGFDSIEWAATQEWSTGKIGTFGISSDGQWQLIAATHRPPHLKAMFVSYPARGGQMENGVHTSTGIGWHALNGAFSRPLESLEDWQQWVEDWRKSELPMLASFINPRLLAMFQHPPADEYWRRQDPTVSLAQVSAPVLLECGWYDRYVRWTLDAFADLQTNSDKEVQPHHKVVFGPWLHGGSVPPAPEPANFPEVARLDRRALHLRWFDQWLRDKDTGALDDPPVRIYLMGDHRWLDSKTWPLPGGTTQRLFLRDGNKQSEGLLLTETPDEAEEADSYEHNPYDPVPTIGGHGGVGRWWRGGPLDQRPAEAHSLTFSTPVLESDLTVIGGVNSHIHASSSVADTDFILTLSDVYPDGYSAILRQSAVSARYREAGQDQLLNPGEPFEVEIAFPAIANVFKAGHRLRLTIASSSFPAFLPNPGTGEPPHLASKGLTATNRIFHDSQRPSFIELTVYN